MTDTAVVFNPFEPGFFDDPYVQYSAMRASEPVHQSLLGPWVLTAYDDVVRVLRDPSLSAEDRNMAPMPMQDARREAFGESSGGSRAMLNLDPPDHDRLRRLVQKAFTPRMVESLRPNVERWVDVSLDAISGNEHADVISDLAFPLPFTVISEMLGMPDGNRDELRMWSHAVVKTLDPVINDVEIAEAVAAGAAMNAYVRDVIALKRHDLADDLLSGLIAAEEGGDVLDEEELVDQVMLLYVAGHETTVNLIGNGTRALLTHPDQAERLRADPGLDANAIEELLRWDSPVQFSRRIAMSDFLVGDVAVEKGAVLLTCLGAANRDPHHWGPSADDLDLGRVGAAQHVSFGSGVHHCLGASLARVEGRAAIGKLFRRFPELELVDEEPAWNDRIVLRGLDRLPVSLGRNP